MSKRDVLAVVALHSPDRTTWVVRKATLLDERGDERLVVLEDGARLYVPGKDVFPRDLDKEARIAAWDLNLESG